MDLQSEVMNHEEHEAHEGFLLNCLLRVLRSLSAVLASRHLYIHVLCGKTRATIIPMKPFRKKMDLKK